MKKMKASIWIQGVSGFLIALADLAETYGYSSVTYRHAFEWVLWPAAALFVGSILFEASKSFKQWWNHGSSFFLNMGDASSAPEIIKSGHEFVYALGYILLGSALSLFSFSYSSSIVIWLVWLKIVVRVIEHLILRIQGGQSLFMKEFFSFTVVHLISVMMVNALISHDMIELKSSEPYQDPNAAVIAKPMVDLLREWDIDTFSCSVGERWTLVKDRIDQPSRYWKGTPNSPSKALPECPLVMEGQHFLVKKNGEVIIGEQFFIGNEWTEIKKEVWLKEPHKKESMEWIVSQLRHQEKTIKASITKPHKEHMNQMSLQKEKEK